MCLDPIPFPGFCTKYFIQKIQEKGQIDSTVGRALVSRAAKSGLIPDTLHGPLHNVGCVTPNPKPPPQLAPN